MPLTWLDSARKTISLIAPFFAYGMYEIPVYEDDSKGTAYTNGTAIYMPTWSLERWGLPGTTAVYLHELEHVFLMHIERMKSKKYKMLWNISVDIVVNGFIASLNTSKIELPEDSIRDKALENYSAEEVYKRLEPNWSDEKEKEAIEATGMGGDLFDDGSLAQPGALKEAEGRLARAKTVFYSNLTNAMKREIESAMEEKIPWETLLNKYLMKYADDYSFTVYDRRFEDFFLPDIHGEKIKGRIEVDTSGSISPETLSLYVGEIISLMSAFPRIELTVSLFHTSSYAEYEVSDIADLKQLKAQSGGTSFIDSLEKAEKEEVAFVIFLTDLYGAFPASPPENVDVIWISNGATEAPFGEVIPLEEENPGA